MAPSSGTQLVPKAVYAIKSALSRSSAYVRLRLSGQVPELVPAVARQPIPRLAALRQARSRPLGQQRRLFTTALARLGLAARTACQQAPRTLPSSATRTALSRTTLAPFSSPLRPNLTGGVLPRAAGGYGLGGGSARAARHFSSAGASGAQVAQNVHAAVRAFWLKGYTGVYDGVDARGSPRFRAVGKAQAGVEGRVMGDSAKGTSLDFKVAPALTALGGLAQEELAGGLVEGLAGDFARQLGDLAAVHADLKRLAALGTLPVSCPVEGTLRVRFPGCDGDAVTRLCEEVGVTRGVVREDEAWKVEEEDWGEGGGGGGGERDVEMALLFPWAPADDAGRYFGHPPSPHELEWRSMMDGDGGCHSASPAGQSSAVLVSEKGAQSPLWLGSDFESVASASDLAHDALRDGPTGYEGVEGIYRFLAELERAERR